jgi:hypothetical protein
VFEAAVEVFEAAVEVSRLSSVKAAVDVEDTILEINTTVEVRVVRFLSKVLSV